MLFRDGFLQVGGDQRLHDHAAGGIGRGDDTVGQQLPHAIVGHQRADLVAREQFHLAAAIARGHAHPVAIGIRRDDQVGAFLLGEIGGHRERFGILGIGRFDRRETAIFHLLLRDGEIMETQAVEHRFGDDAARAVDRSEDDL